MTWDQISRSNRLERRHETNTYKAPTYHLRTARREVSYGTYCDGTVLAELEQFSPLGEDFFCFPLIDFANKTMQYREDFDPEHHTVSLYNLGRRHDETNDSEGWRPIINSLAVGR